MDNNFGGVYFVLWFYLDSEIDLLLSGRIKGVFIAFDTPSECLCWFWHLERKSTEDQSCLLPHHLAVSTEIYSR